MVCVGVGACVVRRQRFAAALSDIGDALAEVEGLAGALEGEMGAAKDTLRTLEDDNAHRRHLYLALLQRQVCRSLSSKLTESALNSWAFHSTPCL